MSQALAPNQQKILTIKDYFAKASESFAQVLPKHLTPERMIKVALSSITRTPALLQCTPQSLIQAVMVASQLGLEAGGILGEAYLVPFGNQCTLIPGYRGLIALARRSGQISSVEARVVHNRDTFSLRYGLEVAIDHEPCWREDPGELVAVYAIARFIDGTTQVEVMTRSEVDKIRARSKASGAGPWVTDYEEMARKTVVRRLMKYLPLSVEMATALELERDAERGERGDYAALLSVDLPETIDAEDAKAEAAGGSHSEPPQTAKVKDALKSARTRARAAAPAARSESAAATPKPAPSQSPVDAEAGGIPAIGDELVTGEESARISEAADMLDITDVEWERIGEEFGAETVRDFLRRDFARVLARISAIADERAAGN